MMSQQQPSSQMGGGQHQQSAQDAASIKLTRGTSCVLCQQRKVRCDKNKPCSNCVKAGVECRVVPPQPPRRRKKRLHEKDLVDRLKKYEELLKENGVKFDSLDKDFRGDDKEDDVDDLENDFEGLKTTPEDSASPSSTQASRFRPGPWFSVHKEFRASEKLLHDSSDEEEVDYSTIYQAFDKMFGHNQDIFPFLVGYSGNESVTDAHPSTIHIFQLWQIYIDNVNTLLKITHVPTIQGQVIEASSNLKAAPKNIEALMFAIYVMAVTSLDDEQVRLRFHTSKKELLGRYLAALQQALINAGFMRARDHITLQAYLLYLFAMRWFMDPRQVFCLVGLAVRMAQQMGLHRDPEGHGLPAFEVEQRRRLWWTIVGYDRRLGEMTGSTVTALSSGCDTKLPLNVNDSDLHIERDEPPTSHVGPTEMMFALARTELSMAVSTDSNRDSFNTNESDKPNPAIQKEKSEPTVRIVGQNAPSYTLEGFAAHIEGTYLSHCDPRIPLHFFTQTMIRQNLCKMRVVGFLVKMLQPSGSAIDEVERDKLFLEAIKMVEYDNIVQTAESLKPFRWYSLHYFPFPAYMFLVHELRNRTSGPMVERAWDAITQNHDVRGILNNLHSPMHIAFGPMFIKAFAARETAENAAGRKVPTPPFITTLRERTAKRRKGHDKNLPDPAPPSEAMVHLPHASGQSPSSHGDSSMIVTPGGTTQMVGQPGIVPAPASSETNDMDWSYIMSGYQDNNLFQELTGGYSGGFGDAPNPMGGMGGPPPMGGGGPPMGGGMPMGPNMYPGWKR